MTTPTTSTSLTVEYADKCNAEEAHLIIFNRDPEIPWDKKSASPGLPKPTAASASGGCEKKMAIIPHIQSPC